MDEEERKGESWYLKEIRENKRKGTMGYSLLVE
jgi:hypothetical protein